jgi:ankyrin repeat protein
MRTPLHYAVYNTYPETILAPLESGAAIMVDCEVETSHWHNKDLDKSPEIIRMMIDAGACVMATDADGKTAFHLAVQNRHTERIRELLRMLDYNRKEEAIVCYAATNNNPEVVRTLLEYGASVDAADRKGRTPLHDAARESSNAQVVQLLLDHGASLTTLDQNGETPLHQAARQTINPEIITILVNNGASVTEINQEGKTALELLEANSNIEEGEKQLLFQSLMLT